MEMTGVVTGKAALKELLSSSEGRLLAYAEAVGTFREKAAEDPETAIKSYFGSGVLADWMSRITSEILYPVQADFFQGGILMSGPQDSKSGIVAIYNPWWDAILLLKGKLLESTGEAFSPLKIGEFYFLSGETFRGEPIEEDEKKIRRLTVIPEADPISVELWRVTAASKNRFERVFANDDKVSWGALSETLLKANVKREMCRIACRAGLRLKLKLALLKNAEATGIGAHVVKMARDGNLFQLYSYFEEPNSRKLLSDFVQIPSMFRKDFTLYGYVPTSEGTLYIIVNRKFPRLYVTVSVPSDVPKSPASFEWFDLSKSAEMLAIWNAGDQKEKTK